MVKTTSGSSEREFIVVSSARGACTDSFIVVGGYHEESDSVLVMDVAKLKHPMHWASLADVVDAMSREDPSSTVPGGFMKLSKSVIPECAIKPLHVPQVSRAAGKQLSGALMDALESPFTTVFS